MLEIQQQIIGCNKSVRSIQPQWIVIHDTADNGATAQNEHDYFSGGDRGASADFFVDSNNIIQIIDTDSHYSWAIGDGHGMLGKYNSNSCSIEMCLPSSGYPTEETIQNTLDLTKYLMNKYGLDINHVIRHYDCSYKNCPASFNQDGNWSKWFEFKDRLANSSDSSWKKGWNKNSTGWWYCTDLTNKYYYKDSWQLIDGQYYSFDTVKNY
jgi:N-acetylmuramoyl-L-alanine amidase CwlA